MTETMPNAPSTSPHNEQTATESTQVSRLRYWICQRPDLMWGLVLFCVTYVTLRITSPLVGFVRDEGYYFKAGEQYFSWYRELWRNLWSGQFLSTFSDATITRYFEYNNEHPVLIKTLMGFTWWFTHEVLGITSNAEGFRVIGPLFAGLCVAFTFALARRAKLERTYAAFAGLAWLLMPHNYFYSHLACFDVPVTAMTVLVVYSYLASRTSMTKALLAGLVFGLACATKHNALFLFFLLGLHFVIVNWRSFGFVRGPLGGLRLPPIPLVYVFMLVCAPLIMYLHWPYLWHHPLQRFGSYLAFHANHEHYPISLGSQLLVRPPFPISFPFEMTAYATPLMTLLLMLIGGAYGLWRLNRSLMHGEHGARNGDGDSEASTMLMWGIMAMFPIVLIALPSVPIFGGTKHWMPATPFLALFAALALQKMSVYLSGRCPQRFLSYIAPVVVVLALLPSLWGTIDTHPYGMSYYNELAGGVRGGAEKNLQRTFWGHSDRKLIANELNRAPRGSRVFFNRTNFDSFRMYQRDGILNKNVSYASSVAASDFALVFHQGGYFEEMYKVWNEYGTQKPIAGVYLHGVPLVTLYARPGKQLSDTQ